MYSTAVSTSEYSETATGLPLIIHAAASFDLYAALISSAFARISCSGVMVSPASYFSVQGVIYGFPIPEPVLQNLAASGTF
jgi:hypothetical protein